MTGSDASPADPPFVEPQARLTARAVTATVMAVLLGAAIGWGLSGLVPASYDSEAQVIVGSPTSAALFQTFDQAPTDRSLETQAQVLTSDDVLRSAAERLDVSLTSIRNALNVSVAAGSNVISVEASQPTPQAAQELLGAVVTSYVDFSRSQVVSRLRQQADSLTPVIQALREQVTAADAGGSATLDAISSLQEQRGQFRAAAASEAGPAQVISAASEPEAPSSPSAAALALVGAAVALLGSVALIAGLRARRRRPSGVRLDQERRSDGRQ